MYNKCKITDVHTVCMDEWYELESAFLGCYHITFPVRLNKTITVLLKRIVKR